MIADTPYSPEQAGAEDALETLNDFELQLARLQRQRLLSDEAVASVKDDVAAVRDRLEEDLQRALLPKGPRLA